MGPPQPHMPQQSQHAQHAEAQQPPPQQQQQQQMLSQRSGAFMPFNFLLMPEMASIPEGAYPNPTLACSCGVRTCPIGYCLGGVGNEKDVFERACGIVCQVQKQLSPERMQCVCWLECLRSGRSQQRTATGNREFALVAWRANRPVQSRVMGR